MRPRARGRLRLTTGRGRPEPRAASGFGTRGAWAMAVGRPQAVAGDAPARHGRSHATRQGAVLPAKMESFLARRAGGGTSAAWIPDAPDRKRWAPWANTGGRASPAIGGRSRGVARAPNVVATGGFGAGRGRPPGPPAAARRSPPFAPMRHGPSDPLARRDGPTHQLALTGWRFSIVFSSDPQKVSRWVGPDTLILATPEET